LREHAADESANRPGTIDAYPHCEGSCFVRHWGQ
jgi:hypothetical protein